MYDYEVTECTNCRQSITAGTAKTCRACGKEGLGECCIDSVHTHPLSDFVDCSGE